MPRKSNKKRADGRISVQVYIGRGDDGKRKYKTVYGRTQAEADAAALDVKIKLKKGINISASRESFKFWADKYIDEKDLSFRLSHRYQAKLNDLKCTIDKFRDLYGIPIVKITNSEIKNIILKNAIKNDVTGCPSSMRTLQNLKSAVEGIFDLAIDNRITEYNPAARINLHDLDTKKHPAERRALTDEEQSWVLNTPHRAQLAAMIMMYAGLRRGELIPLTWSDLDLKKGTLSIKRTVTMVGGRSEIKEFGKSDAALRTIYLPDMLINYLDSIPKKSIYICPSASDDLMNDSGWKSLWNSYLADINMKYGDFSNYINKPKSKYDPKGVPFVIPRFTAHWLRHTYATFLYLSGVDVMTAKEQMGHSNIKTTLNIYTHLDELYKERKMDKLNIFIKNASHMQVNAI